jgi:hypothetical protein
MGLCWFLGGVVVGVIHGWTVSWTVGSLHPQRTGHAILLVLGGALLRTAAVATVLTVAVAQELTWGLLASAGFLVSRMGYTAIMAARIAQSQRSPQEGG